MRHRMMGKQLSRSTSHRIAMRRNMASSLFEHGAIRTTEAKAKELRRFVEKLITIARKGDLASRRRVVQMLGARKIGEKDASESDYRWYRDGRTTVVQLLFDDIAPKYADRPGGYTRIIRLADRRIGDAGKQVILQLVEESSGEGASEPQKTSRRAKRAAKRVEAASGVTTEEETKAPFEETAEESAEAPAEEEASEDPSEKESSEDEEKKEE
ncbi:MAG: 50S ribosomal protein L17 [Phycisphaerae bacterium]